MVKNLKPLREKIYNQLMQEIITGKLNAGERLSEAHLASRFNVSRTPIREALLQLEKLGYVVHKKNIGSIVKKMSPKGVNEIFEVVAALEGHAVEVFGEMPPGPNDLEYLEHLQAEMRKAGSAHNYLQYSECDRKFHHFLTKQAGNQTLMDIISSQRARIYRIVARGSTFQTNIEDYLYFHDLILKALRKGYPQKAGTLMKQHVRESGRLVCEALSPLEWLPENRLEDSATTSMPQVLRPPLPGT